MSNCYSSPATHSFQRTMTAEWAFAGRSVELAALREISPARPILLRGPAGIGKTRLARAVAADRRDAIWLAASEQLTRVRYGAFTPLLTALSVDSTGEENELLARVDRVLAARAEPPLVVVDDIGRADAGTLAGVALLAERGHTCLVLTARDTDPVPELINRLYDADTIEVIELGPLDRSAVEEVLVAAIGGPLDPETLSAFVDQSGGNPLLLRELVRGATAAGPVVTGPNGLRAVPVPSRRLVELIEERFAGLPDRARDLVELLALTGPIDATAVDTVALELLERDGLVAAAADGAMQLAHPLYAEVLVAELPPTRLRRTRGLAADVLRRDRSGAAQLRAAMLRLDNGDDLARGDVEIAADHALAVGDHAAVLRLTEIADDSGLLRRRGHSLSHLGDPEAAATLDRAIASAGDDEQRARATRALAEHLAVRTRQPGAAVERIDTVSAAIVSDEWRAFLAADRTRWAILVGEHPNRPASAIEGDDEVARLNVTMTDALVAVMAGHLDAADRHITTGLPLAERLPSEVPNGADLLRLTRSILLLFGGDLERSRSLSVAELDVAGAGAESSGMWQYAIALVDLHAGRAAAAADRSREAIRLLEWRDFTGIVATAHAVHASALAQLGRTGEAREAIDRLGPAEALDIWAALQRAQADAWLSAAERRRPALAELVAVSRRAVAAGQVCLAALTSHVAVRLGSPELVVDDLHDAALRTEGALMPALAAHGAAAAARRPTDLLESGERLATLGLVASAGDAALAAAQLFRAAGRGDAAEAATRQASKWSGSDGGASHDLTARELEIARSAADRWSSREIAERLGVSVRTVDNHLNRVYRKLAISGRPELADALRSVGAVA